MLQQLKLKGRSSNFGKQRIILISCMLMIQKVTRKKQKILYNIPNKE